MKSKVTPGLASLSAATVMMCMAATLAGAQTSSVGGFDGIYSGTNHRTVGNDPSCAPEATVTVRVEGGRLTMPWAEPTMFGARINPDGGFHAVSGNQAWLEKHMATAPTLSGRLSGATLTAEYGTRICRYTLEARRS
jgi:hypothetical protein